METYKDIIFRVQPGKPNVVSRKDGDLLLLGDQSISRKHAEVTVHSENQRGGIVLKDLGSKYGTFTKLGGGELAQVSPNEPITLNNGDVIRFGIQWNTWRVEYFPLVVATSTLNTGEKTEVKEVVAALGGEMVNDWQACCTHLTMNKLTVTVKVVCALACGKPIVVPGYWKTLQVALASTEAKLPDCQDFVPPLAEALLNPSEVSFAPNPERGKLFSGYTFVAASAKQLSRIRPMIIAAGGNAVEFSVSLWPDSKLMSDKTVLMHHTAGDKQGSQQSQVPDGYIAAARKLKAAGVRCVPESEIGLSILHCSMAQYCNPRFSPQSLLGASASQSTQQITVVCPSTEDSIKPQKNGVMSGSATTSNKKRALEEPSEEEQHPSKKINSEDIFSSQADEDEVLTEKNWNLPPTSFSKSGLKEKQPIVNPSLDMFAPSGQISGQSDQNKNTLNKATSSTSENIPKERQLIVNPSLDMFAPSGQTSKRENKSEVNPSCQDIFASNESRQNLEKKRSGCDESRSVPNKQPRMGQLGEENDDFSFVSNKRTSKLQKTVEKEDEFSFVPARKSNKRPVIAEDDEDEFSFASTRKGNHQKRAQDPVDEFSFVSSKSSKKRNRQSNPDMFDSSADCLVSNGRASTSSTKNNNCSMAHNGNQEENDDLFAFAGGPAPKRRKDIENSQNVDESDTEVKLALFSKKDNSSLPPQNASEQIAFEEPADEKNLMTFSKDKPYPVIIKEEIQDDEVDELAKVLHNATIIVVKPLVVVRQKPSEAQPTSGGKNFKKFHKVTGINKRIVPHIIGGSDLVPHYASSRNIDDVLPPSPPSVIPDDDWGFPNEKRKGKNR